MNMIFVITSCPGSVIMEDMACWLTVFSLTPHGPKYYIKNTTETVGPCGLAVTSDVVCTSEG